MVRLISKKMLSFLLMLCITISMISVSFVSVSAAAPAPVKPNIWTNTAKSFSVNKIYTNGLLVCGTALVRIADSTNCEEFQSAVSFLNKWVFGGSQGQTLAAIKSLCTDILDEVQQINSKLTSYTSKLQKIMSEIKYNEAMRSVDDKWQKDVTNIEDNNNVRNTLSSYQKYMDVAQKYNDGKATLDDVKKAQNVLFDDFCRIYSSVNGGFHDTDNTYDKKRAIIFSDSTIDDVMVNTIRTISSNLNNDTNYADVVAQFAFESLPFCSDQYEYIKVNIDKQFTEIVILEMLYQEFISQRGDYLKEKYPEDEERWESYGNYLDSFKMLNENVADEMNTMLDRNLKVSPVNGIYMKLEEYPKTEDAATVVMRNFDYQSPYSLSIFAHFVKKDVKFNRVFTLTNNGINSFCIFDGTQYDGADNNEIPDHLHMIKLVDHESNPILADVFWPSGDFFNLTTCAKYGDGTNNNYKPIQSSADFYELFNTPAFALCDSKPINYLSDYLSYANGYPIYFMTSDFDSKGGGSVIVTTFPIFKVIDAYQQEPEANFGITKVDVENIQEGKSGYNTAYSIILANKDATFNQKTSVAVNGSGNAEIYIEGDNGEKATSITKAAGSEVVVHFKPTSDNTVLQSVSIKRHNNASDKNNVTSEVTALSKEQIELLDIDENGYYIYKFTTPYSDATVSLNTQKGYRVYSQGRDGSTDHILLDSYTNVFAEGETVNFIADENVISVSLQYNNSSKDIELKEADGSDRTGSFVMPNCDVTLYYMIDCDHNYSDGFCTKCGFYEPAVYNSKTGNYEIGNAGQLFWFAALVNGDSTYADFDKQNKSANAVLTADIDLNGREWTPIGNYSNGNSLEYKGRFNGQNHTISGVKITKKGDHLGIFGKIVGTTVENFTVKGDITLNQQGTSVGGAVGKASGATISNVSSYVNISMKGGNYVGGIVGYSTDKSSIKKCCNAGNVSGSSYIGGVVGSLYGTIENCYNTGKISGGYSVGGILGTVETNGLSSSTVKYSHNVGAISCGDKAGGIVGLPGLNTASNCYYLDTCGSSDKYSTSKTAEQFSSGEVAYLLNNYVTSGKQIWYQNIDNGKAPNDYPKFEGGTVYCGYKCNETEKAYSNYPLSSTITDHNFNIYGFCIYCGAYQPAYLNSDGVYEISNAGQLFWFASLVNGDRTHADFDSQNGAANAVLVKDIVVNSVDMSKLASTQSDSLRKWNPIGTSDNSYSGKFDGQGHTISGIYFNDSNVSNVGLFGYTRGGANIYNVGVVNSYIEGRNCVGGIIGRNNNSGVTIQKCFSEATIIGNEDVGGIEGSTYGGKIINCYNAGSVTGSKYVGSIRGHNTYNTTSSGAMNNCFNVGEVIGTGTDNIGGIRGDGNGTISNCYCISNQLTDTAATTKIPEQFASGEVAYLLNNSVTDGKQVWYQNIDNDKTPDDYPRFNGGTVYYLEYKDTYSNTYSEKPAEPDAFDKDDDGNLIISTYDDLVKLSELIISDYDVYGSQNYILANNIKASDDSEWTQGIGSVEDNKPFNGTFNGKGYCIVGLNVNSPKNGGLFEIIGEKGKVKDLFVYDCDFKASSGTSGGIAAINNGTIDHCISGINLTSGIIHINSDITIDAVALNSSIKGELSGGITGENNGLITGSRNAAVVTGAQCGGIAAENNGKIYGCANSVKIGASSSSVSGGLVGRNCGIIESSYNSGTVSGNTEKTTGSIAGINGYDGAENPTVKNVFYTTVNNLNAVGTDSLTKSDETNKAKSKNSDFQSDDFVNELNSVSDDTVTWVRKAKFNKGNPTIKSNFFMYNVISAGNGITIEGSMHEALNIQYNVCNEKDEEYIAITSALDKTSVSGVYSVSLTDNDGNYIPDELWCQGDYKISVPVSGNNVEFAAIDTDGQINYYKPDSVENGIAVFTVSHPMSFAVVDRTSTNKNISDNTSTDKAVINTSNDNTPIQTGSTVCCSVLLIVMFASAFVIVIKRRNNFE